MSEPQVIITNEEHHSEDARHEEEGHHPKPASPLIVSPTLKSSKKIPTLNSSSPISSSPEPNKSPYPELYSIPPSPPPLPSQTKNELDVVVEPPQPPFPVSQGVTKWHKILYPAGVNPTHRKYEHWVGRIGFGAKGLVYSFVGGMTCASASKLTGELNDSPQGAFILIGDFPAGKGLLVVMLLSLMCYIAWRWWECFTYQGADATFSPFKNFFAFRLSPFISGCVYIAYSVYIIQILANDNGQACYPECWRHSALGKAALTLFGVAFSIACLTQLLNAFTRKWHFEIDWARCNKYEKYTILGLGHAGFVGRSGLFLFVAILMFRALRGSVKANSGHTIANGINQFIGTGAGRVFMFIFGFMTLLYGIYAILCTRYKIFPTPPPSGTPLVFRHEDADANMNMSRQVSVVREQV